MWVVVGGGGMRPNTATSRSLLAFASTTLSISDWVLTEYYIRGKYHWKISLPLI